MRITTFQESIEAQIAINRFLNTKGIKDLVGDYGELLFKTAFGGELQLPTNKGFDVSHEVYGRVEIKTRKWERKHGGGIRKENRAVGFKGKEGAFDWLAHIVLDSEYKVAMGTLVKYKEVWPEIQKSTQKVGFSVSSSLPSSINILDALRSAEVQLGVGV